MGYFEEFELPKLTEEDLEALTDEEREEFREFESYLIGCEAIALDDICTNCKSKRMFAATYEALKLDKYRTMEKAKNMENIKISPQMAAVQRKSYESVIDAKLQYLNAWYFMKWEDTLDVLPTAVFEEKYNNTITCLTLLIAASITCTVFLTSAIILIS